MSERMAGAEIVALIQQAQASQPPAMAIAMHLAGEIRRLQGLIEDWDAYYSSPTSEDAEPLRGAVHALEAEAKAIRAEQTKP